MRAESIVAASAGWIELAGLLALIGGAVVAIVYAVRRLRREGGRVAYRGFRADLGRAIILSLELLVASDIVRTLGQTPTLQDVAVLAAIVAIRTFLSFTLAVELDGCWPWQTKARRAGDATAPAPPVVVEVPFH